MGSNKGLYAIVGALVILAAVFLIARNGTPAVVEQATVSETIPQPSGLLIEDSVVGLGAEAKAGNTAVVHYRGTLGNGSLFDSSYDRGEPFSFTIGAGEVIRGWDEGILGMRVGGTRKLTIPATLAYGEKGVDNVIPRNATLIFEVELLELR